MKPESPQRCIKMRSAQMRSTRIRSMQGRWEAHSTHVEFQFSIRKEKKNHTRRLVKYGNCKAMASLYLEIFRPWLEKGNMIYLWSWIEFEVGPALVVVVRNNQVTSKGPFLHELFNDSMMNTALLLLPAWWVPFLLRFCFFITMVETVFILKWALSHEETRPSNISWLLIKLMQDQPTSCLNVSNLWSLARVLVLLLSVLSQVLRLQSSSCHPPQKVGI